ncbi:MAG: glutamate-ammonia-ligase adenylyltransferase [Lentisphaeria bacterium]|nr:glutamate-ammonia-ligase adenylyltransferase [Lentisphaeria bacterium]
MGFTAEQFARALGLPVAEAERSLQAWGDRYRDAFTLEQALQHREMLSRLGPAHPVAVAVDSSRPGRLACTVVAHDYPALFSLITGILGAMGFSVLSGDVFTSRRVPASETRRRSRPGRRREAHVQRRRIIDRFEGLCDPGDVEAWSEDLRRRLAQVLERLATGREEEAVRARHLVYEQVARRMEGLAGTAEVALYPVEIHVGNEGPFTRLEVHSQDTPFFLYTLANALALHGISIERVAISTSHDGQVSDRIDVLDRRGGRILAPDRLDQLRFSVALTKQFTYCLGSAPDPYTALTRFEKLTEEVFHDPDRQRWLTQFDEPDALRDLARVLGASDFLWEDFIHAQYETLLPLLQSRAQHVREDFSQTALRARLHQALAGCTAPEALRQALNAWKDHEMFRVDLQHLLDADPDARHLAEPLTCIAEMVLETALNAICQRLQARHGSPRTVGGMPTSWAVAGLGKFGGVALGYASDIELLFVYADNGATDGREPIANAQFFDAMVQEVTGFVTAKREGVFRIDLRLRPYGSAGPLACSLDSFCRYYGPGGAARSYERLALVRLRAVAGDADLGARIERLRDQFVYESTAISLTEVHRLREKQLSSKVPGERPNAKFSPGALVDIEYCVQMLQVMHGGSRAELRTPRIHEALHVLARVGVLEAAETNRLTRAYDFLRRLINALRMLRGHALDLFLPDPASLEYRHLARRMGYRKRRELDVDRQLYIDFETETAVVRAFVQEHFGREAVPGSGQGNIVDVLLGRQTPESRCARVLSAAGLTDPQRALHNLRSLAGAGPRMDTFLRLAVLAMDVLRFTADPDMALNNWERFVGSLAAPAAHFDELLLQPRRLEILLGVFATSQFLADVLVRNPEFIAWATDPDVLHSDGDAADMRRRLEAFVTKAGQDPGQRLDAVRRFRRREILRIGIRDLFLKVPVHRVTADLADLAEAILDWCTREAYGRLAQRTADPPDLDRFCILAFGKCGGRELNYSSDIDLVGVFEEEPECTDSAQPFFERLLETVRADLMGHSAEGFLYRVDFRLRPYGRAGTLAVSLPAAQRYYDTAAALWERQALLKARPVAGNRQLGSRLLHGLHAVLRLPADPAQIAASIRTLRAKAVRTHASPTTIDIKTGPGGIRDVEFLVQALQLAHAHRHPSVLTPGTMDAIRALVQARVLDPDTAERLLQHYATLRRIEHFLQILEDRQTHALPTQTTQLDALARRALGPQHNGADLLQHLARVTRETADIFQTGIAALAARDYP